MTDHWEGFDQGLIENVARWSAPATESELIFLIDELLERGLESDGIVRRTIAEALGRAADVSPNLTQVEVSTIRGYLKSIPKIARVLPSQPQLRAVGATPR